MIKKVTLESYPDCPCQDDEQNACNIVGSHCYEKAPDDCPLRKDYLVIAAAGEFEKVDG